MPSASKFSGFELQATPPVYQTALPGDWLLSHTTPSWRMKDPEKGFQRMVKQDRAKAIAVAVLDQQRNFPNSLVLATDIPKLDLDKCQVLIPNKIKFLVVDGQHRLWAQKFSQYIATYSCTVHCGLTEVEMARLFLEINDNQKRVPASLRWDLVRLVRPEDDLNAIIAADVVCQLAQRDGSPLFQKIDLTGEEKTISLKQGSIAPEIKYLAATKGPLHGLNSDLFYDLIEKYLAAIRSLDNQGWKDGSSPFYQARVLRVLLRLLPEIMRRLKVNPEAMNAKHFSPYLERIPQQSLNLEQIKAKQGRAGMNEIQKEIANQMFSK